eukprot:4993749-Prymnesium_polylepis.2
MKPNVKAMPMCRPTRPKSSISVGAPGLTNASRSLRVNAPVHMPQHMPSTAAASAVLAGSGVGRAITSATSGVAGGCSSVPSPCSSAPASAGVATTRLPGSASDGGGPDVPCAP